MTPRDRTAHWDGVYGARDVKRVSWYRPRLEQSLQMIEGAGLPPGAAILDVGGGASTLVDDLLDRGFDNVTVLDVSRLALDAARRRLGPRARRVRWTVADVTEVELATDAYDLWHDRAVLHFMVEDTDRDAYVANLRRALRPGGHVVLATFAPDGPSRCSGLPVRRYSAQGLLEAIGPGFALADSCDETHVTPAGTEQRFTWARLVHDGTLHSA